MVILFSAINIYFHFPENNLFQPFQPDSLRRQPKPDFRIRRRLLISRPARLQVARDGIGDGDKRIIQHPQKNASRKFFTPNYAPNQKNSPRRNPCKIRPAELFSEKNNIFIDVLLAMPYFPDMRTKQASAEVNYLAQYKRAMAAIEKLQNAIHDLPAPEGEIKIDWSHVGSMCRFADCIDEIIAE